MSLELLQKYLRTVSFANKIVWCNWCSEFHYRYGYLYFRDRMVGFLAFFVCVVSPAYMTSRSHCRPRELMQPKERNHLFHNAPKLPGQHTTSLWAGQTRNTFKKLHKSWFLAVDTKKISIFLLWRHWQGRKIANNSQFKCIAFLIFLDLIVSVIPAAKATMNTKFCKKISH